MIDIVAFVDSASTIFNQQVPTYVVLVFGGMMAFSGVVFKKILEWRSRNRGRYSKTASLLVGSGGELSPINLNNGMVMYLLSQGMFIGGVFCIPLSPHFTHFGLLTYFGMTFWGFSNFFAWVISEGTGKRLQT